MAEPPRCDWRGPLSDVFSHRSKECDLEPRVCEFKGCAAHMLAYQIPAHRESCAFRTTRCVQCTDVVLVTDMAEHLEEECIAVRVRCVHAGCSFGAPRGKIDAHEAQCGHELLECPVDGCGAEVKRRAISAHIASTDAAHVKLLAAHFQELLEEKAADEDEDEEE